MSSNLKLKYAASILNGYAYDSKAYVDDGKPLIRIGDVKKDINLSSTRKIPIDVALSTMRFRIQKSDSLVALTGATIGKSFQYRLSDEAYLNQRVASVRAKKGYDQSFIQYTLSTNRFKDEIQLACFGGAQENIGANELANIAIPRLEYDRQKKAADYLDAKTQTLDKILTAKNHLLDLLEAQKRAAIFNLTTRGVDSSATFRTVPEEWLGSVPEYWQQTYLMGCAYERKKKNYPGNIPTLLSLSYGKLITKDVEGNGGLLPENFDTYQLITAGQIVLRLTDLQNDHKSLRVGYATQDGMITSAYSCVTAKDEVLPKYLYYYLHSADLRKVFYSMGGGVRQSMKFADLKRLVMYIPDKITQQEIVDAIEVKVEQIEKLQDKVKKSINLLEEYRSSLISNVVGGKVEI